MRDYSLYDTVVVGAGPNGLAAAIRMAQEGYRVQVVEANNKIGGGVRSAACTRPGFVHDLCSAIHPLAAGSPFLKTLLLQQYGLQWIQPPYPLAHPLDNGQAVVLQRSLAETAQGLGADRNRYSWLLAPLVEAWEPLTDEVLRPLLHWPTHPLLLMQFGMRALVPAHGLAKRMFVTEEARALFAGLAAHSMLPLTRAASSAFALLLGAAAHTVGWPFPRGGAQQLANALSACLQALGGSIKTNTPVQTLADLPKARAVLLDTSLQTAGMLLADRLPDWFLQRVENYRYGPGVFKIDYALEEPIPWTAPACYKAGTLHLGGTLEEITAAEQAVAEGRLPEQPFVLLAQHSLFDPSRAPAKKHTAWAYCHVPLHSTADMTARIEQQIERFAPGFTQRIIARHTAGPADLQRRNANLVGGDINGGTADLAQLLARPLPRPVPYRLPSPGFYLCSSAAPPGGGVHGMCGYHAAEAVLRDLS